MVIDLVIVTVPKPPGSRQLISPLMKVLEIAPANVLHGAVRLHGLASSPTPETQVRVAWAYAELAFNTGTAIMLRIASNIELRIALSFPSPIRVQVRGHPVERRVNVRFTLGKGCPPGCCAPRPPLSDETVVLVVA